MIHGFFFCCYIYVHIITFSNYSLALKYYLSATIFGCQPKDAKFNKCNSLKGKSTSSSINLLKNVG